MGFEDDFDAKMDAAIERTKPKPKPKPKLRAISGSKPEPAPVAQPDLRGAILRLDEWLTRELPAPDPIVGHWLTTTSRLLFTAPTGIGKSMFWIALGMAMAAGRTFLRWKAWRPCRVLYIDGEMSSRLLKERLAEEAKRLGEIPAGFHALSHEDIENFAPLNTPEGQRMVEEIIAKIGGVDLIIFDNIMCLISGDMKDEEAWKQTNPWQRSLTKRKIGLAWLHHTGHNAQQSYGTKTREWQVDTCLFGEEVKRQDTDVSFKLEFRKARERTPQTRADFADITVALVDNTWTYSNPDGGGAKMQPSPHGQKFLNALVNALAGDIVTTISGRRCVTLEMWKRECGAIGLMEQDKRGQTLFSKYKLELITRNQIACSETLAWVL
jgi:hypothetical protein